MMDFGFYTSVLQEVFIVELNISYVCIFKILTSLFNEVLNKIKQ